MSAKDEKLIMASKRRIEALQRADVPKGVIQKYLDRRRTEQIEKFKTQKRKFNEWSRSNKSRLSPLTELIGQERIQAMVKAAPKKKKQKPENDLRKLRPPAIQNMEPGIMPGSVLQFFNPPFNDLPPITNGDCHVNPGGSTGSDEMFVVGNGGSSSALAGVYLPFVPISSARLCKFRPVVWIYAETSVQAYGKYTAHTTGTLTVRVVSLLGTNELQWAEWYQTLWQDSASGPWDDPPPTIIGPKWEGVIELPFTPIPGFPCLLTVEIGATADDDGQGFWGSSVGMVNTFQLDVRMMEVEEE